MAIAPREASFSATRRSASLYTRPDSAEMKLIAPSVRPRATIGRRLFIDHGMGVVIGETTEIGEDCHIFQGVTLGGTSTRREKRHPTLRDGVVVGAGAKIIGAVVIGEGARIGAGAVVVSSVPPHATVVGVPGHVVAFTNLSNETVETLAEQYLFKQHLQTISGRGSAAKLEEYRAKLPAHAESMEKALQPMDEILPVLPPEVQELAKLRNKEFQAFVRERIRRQMEMLLPAIEDLKRMLEPSSLEKDFSREELERMLR